MFICIRSLFSLLLYVCSWNLHVNNEEGMQRLHLLLQGVREAGACTEIVRLGTDMGLTPCKLQL